MSLNAGVCYESVQTSSIMLTDPLNPLSPGDLQTLFFFVDFEPGLSRTIFVLLPSKNWTKLKNKKKSMGPLGSLIEICLPAFFTACMKQAVYFVTEKMFFLFFFIFLQLVPSGRLPAGMKF